MLTTTAAVALAASVAAAASADTVASPKHRCSVFAHHYPPQDGVPDGTYHISVFNGHMSCTTANGLIRGFWSGDAEHHGGPSDARSYSTLKAYPGFRCYQGAGAGSCIKGDQIAAYSVR